MYVVLQNCQALAPNPEPKTLSLKTKTKGPWAETIILEGLGGSLLFR